MVNYNDDGDSKKQNQAMHNEIADQYQTCLPNPKLSTLPGNSPQFIYWT